jgi:anti-anti-sigma factor
MYQNGTADSSQRGVVRDPGQTAASALVVRTERRAHALVFWLSGALDRATSPALERALDARAGGVTRLIVDLTGLEYIDSNGLDTLTRTHRRTSESDQRLTFRHGPHVGQRPSELTRDAQLRSRAASRGANTRDDDYYFALAMACADVDHQRPSDRPPGASDGCLGQAAGASDAPPPGVARAAPRTHFHPARRVAGGRPPPSAE